MRNDRRRMTGITLPEMGAYVGMLALVGLVVVGQQAGLFGGARIEHAYAEIVRVKVAAEAYRSMPSNNGKYTNVDVEELADNGYNVGSLEDGTGENVYGLDVVLAPKNSNTDVELKYTLGSQEACNQMIQRWEDQIGIKGTPTCAAASPWVFTMMID